MSYTSGTPEKMRRPVADLGYDTATMTGAETLTDYAGRVIVRDPGGANRAITMYTPDNPADSKGREHTISNSADADEVITVDSTWQIARGQSLTLVWSGSAWGRIGGAAVASAPEYLRGGAGAAGSSGTGTTDAGDGGAVVVAGGAGGASTSTAAADGGDGGAASLTGGAGGSAAGTDPGGAGGAASLVSGAGGAKTGTGAAAGGAAGAVAITGGVGGATASSGADAGGAGADIAITAGAGGAASAGTGNGGAGGTIVLTAGSGGTSAGGTAGKDGIIRLASAVGRKLSRATIADTGTLTAAQHRGGIIYQDASGGNVTCTTLTGTLLSAEFPDLATGEAIPLFHASNHAANTSTLAGGTDVTLVGSGAVTSQGGQYLLVKTAATTFDLVRVG